MRRLSALALIGLFAAGCTPAIPVKDAFGVSGQQPAGPVPPEFAAFNNYDPRVALLLGEEMCATPYELQVRKALEAAPGQIVAATGRCEPYLGPFGKLNPPLGE
ncbi:MAG TPA: hypothetical protein VMF05_11750 [Stellaceae bacterium]|nr:hypothetical protein [Stellaceae bacterium]